eukprot:gene31614-38206_t
MLLLFLVASALLSIVTSIGFDPVSVTIDINGCKIPAIIDTGAEISVMSLNCAKRCGLHRLIDTQHSGRAIGVGSSEIVGGIEGLGLRIGPLAFRNKVSILKDSRCDVLIGLDILKRFKCDISLREKILKLYVNNEEVRIPLSSQASLQHVAGDRMIRVETPIKARAAQAPKTSFSAPTSSTKSSKSSVPVALSTPLLSPEEIFDDYDNDEYDGDMEECVSMEGV